MNTHSLVILAIKGALPSALMGLHDMLALADLSEHHSPDSPEYSLSNHLPWKPKVLTASMNGEPMEYGAGHRFVPDCSIFDIERCDGVLIPGFCPLNTGLPPESITNKDCRDWLRRQYQRGAHLGASCSGSFVLGEAGLLNGIRCTTTWWLHYELLKRFPRVNGVWGSAMLQDQRIFTAGGPLSWVDICLGMIERMAGKSAAKRVADFAVVDSAPKSQERYIPQGYLSAADPLLVDAENLIRDNVNVPLTTVQLGEKLGLSERTLHRRLKSLTGESPKVFMSRVKMDMAKTLLSTSQQPIKSIAFDLGFNDDSVFRKAFKKFIGMSPNGYRKWSQRG
ncbi:GlxA family transcriptional regulator [Pleionea sediminis]|uniref:GlxA family transcriptional regulator n=1 Tax=Pleionea sediminis TaxID=2569479 RepID=UPI00197BFA5E|nr:helix-turn-helix domain-containing protein [Pleionea sediminis]